MAIPSQASQPKLEFVRFRRLTLLALGLVFLQILLGATVRATGSGMGCPDWPLCHGQFLPAMNFESILEYSHRAVGALVSVVVTLGAVWVAASRSLRAHLGRLAALMALLIVALVVFGAITVAHDMPPAVVACHLLLAAGLLATWIMMAGRSREVATATPRETPAPGAYRWVALLALGAAFVQLFLGAMVSVSHAGTACPDFPTCYGMAFPPLIGNVGIQMIHRFGAYTVATIVLVLVVLAEIQATAALRAYTRLAALLLVVQIALGISTVLLKVPPVLSVFHLGTGMLLFAMLFKTVYTAFPRLQADFSLPALPPSAPGVAAEASAPATPAPSLRAVLNGYYKLTKPSIVLLVVLTGLPAALIAGGRQMNWVVFAAAIVGTCLAASSAAVFNQYFERERDKVMERTAQRPLPSGLVSANAALAFALSLGAASLVVLLVWTNWIAALIALAGLLFYGFFYTLVLKPMSPQNIVIGGAAGATAPLICWAAFTGEVGLPAWIMFLIIFIWTPPHFWALAIFRLEDYERAGIPMFPVVYGVPATARAIVIYTMLLVPLTLLLVPLGAAGPLYLVSALALGLGFMGLAYAVLKTGSKKDATKLFAYSIVYTLALFTALSIDAAMGGAGLAQVVAAPLR